ncbi:MAG TPA: ATP-dependent Clp protease proteolytic subunit [Mesorhizobium sp.]|jgi:ATP-dependent protease ClpP protease subunit|uniref:ATP-dependent Clp protease proteolytic subunit n=1 Tax=Mesorhizobium sp. TaxID=1871066 RepID=UPI002DDD939C|nr:ATP-dependent Clp protease proteolytic subunit [Mesorhizobium sp.]HEV2503783.1 ATP-dependent Clp protease proteolytic subunit [Mesorhizobium sp.]
MIHDPSYHAGKGSVADRAQSPALPAANAPTEGPGDAKLLVGSNVQINGIISDDLFRAFMKQLGEVRTRGDDLILELMTQGGDADTARRIALELRIFRDHSGKNTFVVGKTAVMSAGITIMAAFGRSNRFLTSDTTLLIHERHITRSITLEGPIESCKQIIREEASALDTAERVEREDFEQFIEGSTLSADDLFERAKNNCYLTAQEALELQLIERIIR